jgi:hypothetical protein
MLRSNNRKFGCESSRSLAFHSQGTRMHLKNCFCAFSNAMMFWLNFCSILWHASTGSRLPKNGNAQWVPGSWERNPKLTVNPQISQAAIMFETTIKRHTTPLSFVVFDHKPSSRFTRVFSLAKSIGFFWLLAQFYGIKENGNIIALILALLRSFTPI